MKNSSTISRRHFMGLLAAAGISLLPGPSDANRDPETFDLVVENGHIIDPASGIDAFGYLGVKGGKIAAVSSVPLAGKRRIDASGMIVAPGFIDVHTHVDGMLHAGWCMAQMGVTTCIGGNCGFSYIPEEEGHPNALKAFFDRIDRDGFPVHHGYLAGTQMFRGRVGLDKRAAAGDRQVHEMADMAQAYLDQGAVGISFGIEYQPGTSSAELAAMFHVARRNRVPVTVHPRYTGRGMPLVQPGALEGYREILDAAAKTGAPLQISHLGGQIAWPASPYDELTRSALEMIIEARRSGVDVAGDCYPYAAWCTPVNAASLDFFLKGDMMRWLIKKRYFLGLEDMAVGSGVHKGKRLSVELLQQLRKEDPDTWIIGHAMRDDLVTMIYEQPFVMVASDGVYQLTDGRPSHPRGRGTFPKALKRMTTTGNTLTLQKMIEKMTTMPAQRFGLAAKGHLAPGADADITVFDLQRIDDRAGYLSPDQAPTGIQYVIVAGEPVLFRGAPQNILPGKAVRRS